MELIEYVRILWGKRWVVLAAFLSTVIATSVLTYLQTPTYEATSTFIIAPTSAYRDMRSMVDVVDAMSRRAEIAGTYAEVASSRTIQQQAADELGLSPSQRRGLKVDSRVVPDTLVLEITVEGYDAQLVQLFADAVGAKVVAYAPGLYEAYGLRLLDQADLSASPTSHDRLVNLALGAVVGVALGVGMAFLTYYAETYLPSLRERAFPNAQAAGASDDEKAGGTAARRGIVRWMGGVVLVVLVSMTGTIAWLSVRGTSAADLPTTRLLTPVMPTAIWRATVDLTDTPLPTVSPTHTPEPSPTPCLIPSGWVAYEVQVGDTLSSLADRHRVTIAELLDANCMSRRVISVGQAISVPGSPEAPTPTPDVAAAGTLTISTALTPTAEPSPTGCIPPEGWTTLYVVEAGDTLYSLALAYGVTVEEIAAANCLESTFLSASQELYLPPLGQGLNRTSTGSAELANLSVNNPTLAVDTNSTVLPAPALLSPADGSEFTASAEVVLRWQPVETLPADGYYVVTLAYVHLGETWYDDVPWTRNTEWALSDHSYLVELSDNSEFAWSVQVVRQTGVGADGRPVGEALSQPSESWKLRWRQPSGEEGVTLQSTPRVPPQ